jgi:hypothetical protein
MGPASDRADDAVDDLHQVAVGVELGRVAVDPPQPLDIDVVWPVDHDLADLGVLEHHLQGTESEDVADQLLHQPLPVAAGDRDAERLQDHAAELANPDHQALPGGLADVGVLLQQRLGDLALDGRVLRVVPHPQLKAGDLGLPGPLGSLPPPGRIRRQHRRLLGRVGRGQGGREPGRGRRGRGGRGGRRGRRSRGLGLVLVVDQRRAPGLAVRLGVALGPDPLQQ